MSQTTRDGRRQNKTPTPPTRVKTTSGRDATVASSAVAVARSSGRSFDPHSRRSILIIPDDRSSLFETTARRFVRAALACAARAGSAAPVLHPLGTRSRKKASSRLTTANRILGEGKTSSDSRFVSSPPRLDSSDALPNRVEPLPPRLELRRALVDPARDAAALPAVDGPREPLEREVRLVLVHRHGDGGAAARGSAAAAAVAPSVAGLGMRALMVRRRADNVELATTCFLR